MYIYSIKYPIFTLGPYDRVCLWTKGCSIRCKGCMSKELWDIRKEDFIEKEKLIEVLIEYPTDKLTISGGEPLDQYKELLYLLKEIKFKFNDILLFTGYELETLQRNFSQIFDYVDVIIYGPFLKENTPGDKLRGSANKGIIYINKELIPIYKKYLKLPKSLTIINKNEIVGVL